MACEIIKKDGDILHARISGNMTLNDQQEIQTASGNLIMEYGTTRLLLTLQDFQGWEKGSTWGDIGFMIGQGEFIAKMAIVGDKRWEEDALVFVGKGLRATQIEFFSAASAKDAETWIRS